MAENKDRCYDNAIWEMLGLDLSSRVVELVDVEGSPKIERRKYRFPLAIEKLQ